MKFKSRLTKNTVILFLILLLSCFSLFSFNTPGKENVLSSSNLKVHFIDVGQGDSILIQCPNGSDILVDAGVPAEGSIVVDYLKDQGVSTLYAIVETHPHEDHIGGLSNVINSFTIKNVYATKATSTTKTYTNLQNLIKDKNLPVTNITYGVTIPADISVSMTFLSPIRTSYSDLNDWSGVLKVQYGDVSFLLMGDASTNVEGDLLSKCKDELPSTVLKVGHHGSSTSSSFLDVVKPQYAVIEVGKDNPYGHPTSAALNRLSDANVKVFRTDLDGTAVFTTDGKTISNNKSTGPSYTIILQIGQTKFTVNGNSRTLDSPPIIKNSRTLLPIRAIIESLNGGVGWDPNEGKVIVTLGSTNLELWIGKNTAKVNGANTPIDLSDSKVVPEIINSRTMLPLRFVTENLGCSVDWNATTKTITIKYPK
jgi:beta-lactamase superfamily II metal-dependent hydrolase